MRRSVRRRLRRQRVAKVAAVVAALLLVAAFLVGVVLPPIAKSQAERRLGMALTRPVTIGQLALNPFRLSAEVRDFSVGDHDPAAPPLLTWRRLYVRFDLLKSLGRAWVLDAVELDGLRGRLEVRPDGSSNISDLLAQHARAPAAGPGRPVRIGSMRVLDSQVEFTDRSLPHPFHTVVGPLTFAITGFETGGAEDSPYHFEATTEAGEKLSWSGTIVPAPFASRGRFELGGVVLKKYFPYIEGWVKAELGGGVVGARGRYAADFDPRARELQLTDAEVHLRELELRERGSADPAVRLKAVDVTGLAVDAIAGRAQVGRVALTGGTLIIRRRADGSVNLRALVPAAGRRPAAAPAAAPDLRVGEVAVDQVDVTFTDDTLPQHPTLGLTGIHVAARDFSVASRQPIPVQVGFKWVPEGSAQAHGTVTLQPAVKADLDLKLKRFALLPLSPYLEAFMRARVGEGTVSTNSAVHLDLGDPPAATVKGDVSFDRFGLVEADHNHEFLGFAWMALGGLSLTTAPPWAATVREVELSGPFVRANLTAAHGLNLAALAPARGPAPAAPGPAPRVEIGKVDIDSGEFSFVDQTLSPNVKVALTNFGGTIAGLSLDHIGRAALDLKGQVDGTGPVALAGSMDPAGAPRRVDLTLTARDVDLLPLGPYAGKYAGYGLARGQLAVDSRITVTGEQVDATNLVTLNQFTFGAASHSPQATNLPVRLGVALLKDANGRIVIDLPVQGSLDDPNFRVGKVVLRVITNLLAKAAVSPFAMVGAMFGGGGDELAYQEFDPGLSALRPAEQPKLDLLAKALASRPALTLGVAGSFDRTADTYALRRLRLEARVRHAVWAEQHAADPNLPPPDQLAITPEARSAAIKRLFDAQFPPGTAFGTPLPPPPVVAPPPAGPPPDVLHRLIDFVTFKAQRDAAEAQRRAAARQAEHQKAVAAAVATGLPEDEMAGRLAEAIPVTTDDLAALAQARAERVRARLLEQGHLDAGRIFLATPSSPAAAEGGPRVLLTLE